MELSGEYRIPAKRERVWEAIFDTDTLAACIPGCESVEKKDDNEYQIACKIKLGPMSLNMKGRLRLSELNPPESCLLGGEGADSAAGGARGEARVTLVEAPKGGTILRYNAKVAVSGRLAQLGSRLINATAKKYADSFFSTFCERLGGEKIADTEASAAIKLSKATRISLLIFGGFLLLSAFYLIKNLI